MSLSADEMKRLFRRTVVVQKPTYGIISGYHELPYVCLGPNYDTATGTLRIKGKIQVSPRFVIRPEHLMPSYSEIFGEENVDMEIAGRVLTNFLQKLLLEMGESFTSSAELEIVRDIKEKLCYVAQNYDEEKAAANSSSEYDKQYTLPDKRVITVTGHVRMTCPELLFKPELNGKTCASLHQLAWKSIQGSDIDIRKDLSKNMILSGGTTMYEGIGERLLKEIEAKAPKSVANFLAYVNKGHYDNTIFHRIIDGFMIQGGGFEPGMKQKDTDAPIENEAKNGLKNDKYTIAMARTSDPHSATAQFFINTVDNGFLNHTAPTGQGWGYAVFGKVVKGEEVVDAIKKVRTTRKGFHDDVPFDAVVIDKAVAL